jgi:hypothetical protein
MSQITAKWGYKNISTINRDRGVRQMIKSTIAGLGLALMLSATPSFAASLIQNGSFEDTTDNTEIGSANSIAQNALGVGGWDVYSQMNGGWYTGNTPGQPGADGFELQRNTVVTAKNGTNYIELESHPGDPSLSTISQDFNVATAGSYILSFWYQPRVDSVGENVIHALFGGVDTVVSGPPNPAFGIWTNIVVIANLALGINTLTFNALGTIDNTLGGFIDHVSVISASEATPVPLPAGLLLLLSGLTGLGFLGRARSKAM